VIPYAYWRVLSKKRAVINLFSLSPAFFVYGLVFALERSRRIASTSAQARVPNPLKSLTV
jgi:hypothetical protein